MNKKTSPSLAVLCYLAAIMAGAKTRAQGVYTLTNGTFSGAGTATVTDTQATNAAEYYVLTQP